MDKIKSIAELTTLGRVRLSRHFFMREMLTSEIGNFCGVPNLPDDPDLAIEVGKHLCELLLEPLHSKFGHVSIRSAFRSSSLNAFGNELFNAGDKSARCAPNSYNDSRHTWDRRDAQGYMGGCATIFIPAYLDYFQQSDDWRALGWWIRDWLPQHDEVIFFDHLGAFNLRWYEGPNQSPILHLPDGSADFSTQTVLTCRGWANFEGDHSSLYAPALRQMGLA